MSKRPIIGGIILAAIIGVVFVGAEINPDNPENEESPKLEIWSARIAGPEFDNISHHRYSPIPLERMIDYEFAFVPSGDSPERIQISVIGTQGRMNAFTQTFTLEKTLVDTVFSEYYTWDYKGDKKFVMAGVKHCPHERICDFDIIVNRYGNLKGSVTISLYQMNIHSLLDNEK